MKRHSDTRQTGRLIAARLVGSFAVVVFLAGCASQKDRLQEVQFDPNQYVVQVGDTIESVAFRYQLTPQQLLSLNPEVGDAIYPGNKLFVRSGVDDLPLAVKPRREVPANYRPRPRRQVPDQTVRTVDPAQGSVVVRSVPSPQDNAAVREEIISESTPIIVAPAPVQPIPPVVAPTPAPELADGWMWPANGEVVRDYAPGEVNGQGLDIAGVPGQEIKAASDGTVIYAGRDLSNSGNLVIVRHTDNLLSTYSHASQLYVAEDDEVKVGDPLASLGTNNNQESVLHFGIRENGKPVDPRKFLPTR